MVKAGSLQHWVPSFGYVIEEKPKPGKYVAWEVYLKAMSTPSGSVKRQRQRQQCKSMVTLHLTLLIGPRPIPKRQPKRQNFKADADADAWCAYSFTEDAKSRSIYCWSE